MTLPFKTETIIVRCFIKQFIFNSLSLQGINTTGTAVAIEKRICEMPEVAFLTIKAMRSLQVYFRSNQDNSDDGPGVIAGYATFKKGAVKNLSVICCP